MRREVLKLLEDARGACAEVEAFIANKTLDDIKSELGLQRSVERSLEILGEALRRLHDLDSEVADRIPDVRRIIGLRNILAHGYDVLDYEIIWDIASNKAGDLRSRLEALIEEDSGDGSSARPPN